MSDHPGWRGLYQSSPPFRKVETVLISPTSPFKIFPKVALFDESYLKQKPETRERFFSCAFFAAIKTLRTPGASTATGFSQKTCLPAFIAAIKWSGRNDGGVANNTTSTPDSITFKYASKPTNLLVSFTLTLSPATLI